MPKKVNHEEKVLTLDEQFGPFVIPQIDETPVGLRTSKPAFSRTKSVSPMHGTQVEDKIVIPENEMHEDIDAAYDQFRVKKKLGKEDEIKKYGMTHHEFDSVDQGDDHHYVNRDEETKDSFGTDINTIEELEEKKEVKEFVPSYDDEVLDYEPEEPIYEEEQLEPETFIEEVNNDIPEPQEPVFEFTRNDSVPDNFETPSYEEKPVIVQEEKKEEVCPYDETSMTFEEPEKQNLGFEEVSDPITTVRNIIHEDRYFSYQYPPVSLLRQKEDFKTSVHEEINRNIERINKTLKDFDIDGFVDNTVFGPTITRYEISLASGVKVSRVSQIEDNLKMNLCAKNIIILAPIPGKDKVGIEVPNEEVRKVQLSEVITSNNFLNTNKPLEFAVGINVDGESIFADIAEMPHLLIAGTTGSGKSVCINTMLISLLMHNSPEDLKMILIDPKRVELIKYRDIPHLITPIVKEPKLAVEAFKWAEKEVIDRFTLFEQYFVRNIESYNNLVGKNPEVKHMPRILIVVDEFGYLMQECGPEFTETIKQIASIGRACGVHIVIATQRPTTDVINGTIKANIQARIAFKVDSAMNSNIILDQGGAEKLLGKGDMWMKLIDEPQRVQCAYIEDEDIEAVTDFIRNNYRPDYVFTHEQLVDQMKKNYEAKDDGEDQDLLYTVACYATGFDTFSIQKVQLKYNIGFPRAQKIVNKLTDLGILDSTEGKTSKKVLKTLSQVEELFGYKH